MPDPKQSKEDHEIASAKGGVRDTGSKDNGRGSCTPDNLPQIDQGQFATSTSAFHQSSGSCAGKFFECMRNQHNASASGTSDALIP